MHIIKELKAYTEVEALHDSYTKSITYQERMRRLGGEENERKIDPEKQRGIDTENVVKDLLITCFDGVVDVFMSEPGSIADDIEKVDLYVKVSTGACYGFQVKSSEAGTRQHIEKYPKNNVPIIWLDVRKASHRVQLVKELLVYLQGRVELRGYIQEAITHRSSLLDQGRKQLSKIEAREEFSIEQRYVLTLLLMAVEHKGQYIMGK